MLTVVQFLPSRKETSPNQSGWRNKLVAKTLRRLAFVDSRFPEDRPHPKPYEHWLVDIIQENQTDRGGCFIVNPLRKVGDDEQAPLVVGMYEIRMDGDAAILVPNDKQQYWTISPSASKSIMEATNAKAVVIDHGGPMWSRRPPAADILAREAKKLAAALKSTGPVIERKPQGAKK